METTLPLSSRFRQPATIKEDILFRNSQHSYERDIKRSQYCQKHDVIRFPSFARSTHYAPSKQFVMRRAQGSEETLHRTPSPSDSVIAGTSLSDMKESVQEAETAKSETESSTLFSTLFSTEDWEENTRQLWKFAAPVSMMLNGREVLSSTWKANEIVLKELAEYDAKRNEFSVGEWGYWDEKSPRFEQRDNITNYGQIKRVDSKTDWVCVAFRFEGYHQGRKLYLWMKRSDLLPDDYESYWTMSLYQ